MVPEPTQYILCITLDNTLPIWCSTLLAFAAIYRNEGPLRKYVYDNTGDAARRGNSRAPPTHSGWHDNTGSDGFRGCLRGLGLYLFGDPHWDRIVSTADPGGAPPHYRGPAPVPYSSPEDGDQAHRRQLAHSRGHRRSAAIRRQWRRKLGGADRALRHCGAVGRHSIALVGDRGLAPPWWSKARSQGGHGATHGICGPRPAGRTCASGRLGARRPTGGRGAGGRLPGMGVWFALFETRGNAKFANARRGDAKLRRWSNSIDRRAARRRIPRSTSWRDFASILASAGLPHRIRVGHRL